MDSGLVVGLGAKRVVGVGSEDNQPLLSGPLPGGGGVGGVTFSLGNAELIFQTERKATSPGKDD